MNRIYRFAFLGDGIEIFHVFVQAKNKNKAEQKLLNELYCIEQKFPKGQEKIDIE